MGREAPCMWREGNSTHVIEVPGLSGRLHGVQIMNITSLCTEDRVTEDMLVTHFLIQPDPVGVKLQGWSEKPFSEFPCQEITSLQSPHYILVSVPR